MKIWQALEQVKTRVENKDHNTLLSGGICENLVDILRENKTTYGENIIVWFQTKQDCFLAWSKFSGSSTYPVPSSNKKLSEWACWDRAFLNATMYQGRYGKLRLELLDHCIDWYKGKDL